MSDLLIILVVLGILIVVGVVVFNWWQEHKYQHKITNDFKPSRRDVLIEDFQINTSTTKKDKPALRQESPYQREPEVDLFAFTEPNIVEDDDEPQLHVKSLAPEPTQAKHTPLENDGVVAPLKANEAITLEEAQPVTPAKKTASLRDEAMLPEALHAQIDLIALLYASIPVTQPRVMAVLASQLKEFTERNFGFGLSHTNEWVSLIESKPEAMFSKLAFSLQLADRGGAVTRATLNRYQHMIETIGLELSTHVEWQSVGDPLNAATTLDQFCIDVDKTVGFHLITNAGAAFHATKFKGLMEAQGLVLGQDGKFHLFNAQVADLLEFSVKNFEGNPFSTDMLKTAVMHGITFQLDIPTVRNSTEVFDRMVSMAKALATSLDATLVDDNRKALGDLQLEKIRQQLKMINATMIAKGIIPGSPQALRLFS
jgi:FtsZ-interacting cell division protein ZipA